MKDILKSNYLSFINPDHENIMYYGFITDVQYVAEDTYTITYEIDNFQTYMHEFTITGEVEREHADYRVLNTLPEDIGLGDYVVDSSKILESELKLRFAIVTTTTLLDNPEGFNGGTATTDPLGVSQPYTYYVVNASNERVTLGSNIIDLMSLDRLNSLQASDPRLTGKIVSVQIVDTLTFPHTLTYQETGENTYRYSLTSPHIKSTNITIENVGQIINEVSFNRNHELNKYGTIQYGGDSSKLNHYPYKVIELSNGDKSSQFKPELVTGSTIKINEKRTTEINSQVAFTIENYANEKKYLNGIIYDQGIKMPIVTEQLSAYIQSRDNAYLSPALQIGSGMIMGIGGLGLGMTGVGAVAGASMTSMGVGMLGRGAMGGIDATINQYKQTEKAKRQPNSISGSIDKLVSKILDVQMIAMVKTQTPEYMAIGVDYFKRYGWKVLKNKQPNINTRKSFNFVKMTTTLIKGNIPQTAKVAIESQFREGVTLWHVDDLGNYSLENTLK